MIWLIVNKFFIIFLHTFDKKYTPFRVYLCNINYKRKFSISGSYPRANISKTTFEERVRKCRAFGPEGLKTNSKNKYYSPELKKMTIADYFKGEYTMFQICKRYDILDRGILKGWIRKYNWNNKIKSHNNKEDRIMTNGRKTTYQERVEIV